jgi:hypothetical protein
MGMPGTGGGRRNKRASTMASDDEPKALVALLALAAVLYLTVWVLTEPAAEPAPSGTDMPSAPPAPT